MALDHAYIKLAIVYFCCKCVCNSAALVLRVSDLNLHRWRVKKIFIDCGAVKLETSKLSESCLNNTLALGLTRVSPIVCQLSCLSINAASGTKRRFDSVFIINYYSTMKHLVVSVIF